MNQNQYPRRSGPRPTPRPSQAPRSADQRHLKSVGSPVFKQERSERAVRFVAIGLLGMFGVLGAGKAADSGYRFLQDWAKDRQEAIANAKPDEEDICFLDRSSTAPRVMGDEYGDGTNKILEISDAVSAVRAAHPDDGVGVCRPAESKDVNDNHIVAPDNIAPEQFVDYEQFEAAGGFSEDVTLGN